MARKTFNEKLHGSKGLPKIEELGPEARLAGGKPARMLVAHPLDYDRCMKAVPYGGLTTVDRIRSALAREAGADFACPLTAGLFVNICAGASEERQGEDVTPYWRTLRPGGELNEKYPGGIEAQKLRLTAEGHGVRQKGKSYFVEEYEKFIFSFS